MATTYQADGFSGDVAHTPRRGAAFSVTRVFTVTAAFVVNDIIQMVKVAPGMEIHDGVLEVTDLESSGTAMVIDVGDGVSADHYIDGSTVGQAGGIERFGLGGTIYKKYTAEDTIDVKVAVAPTTGATTGTVRLTVWGWMN